MAYPPSGPQGGGPHDVPGGPHGYGPYGTPSGPQGFGPYGTPSGYPGYPGHPVGYGPQRVEHPQGTTVLVLGICSLVVCGLCGPFAWSMGNAAKRDLDAHPGAYANESYITIGRILGMIASGLLLVQLAFGILWFVFVVGSIGASTTSGY